MKGFFKKGLFIDLTNKNYETFDLDPLILEKYSGGKGIGTYYLIKFSTKGYDPLSPDAPMVIATGPAGGSKVWGSSRYGLYAKSPLTGFYAESYSGGKAPEAISRTGFDIIVIRGRLEKLSYILINEDQVDFINCENLKGKGTFHTIQHLEDKYRDLRAKAIVIGPAGENLVNFALVENDLWRSAGRCGMGAIFGSKNLKAVVFAGNRARDYADPDGLENYSKKILANFKNSTIVENYRKLGTPMMVAILNQFKAFPTRYWERGYRKDWERISGETLISKFNSRPRACKRCFISCGKLTTLRDGKYRGITIEGPEYETIYAFGGLCLVKELDEIIYLNHICDDLGLDTITAGNVVGYLIKLREEGKIDYDINWGETEKIAGILREIAKCEGLGKELSKGIKHLENKYSMSAMHCKGLEPGGYDPRVFKGMALSYGVSARGACHLRSTFYKAEIMGIIAPDEIKGKAELVADWEDRLTFLDSLILCRFFRDIYLWDELKTIYNLLTGAGLDIEGIKEISRNILQLTRDFNLREGLVKDDDCPSERFFHSTHEGARITKQEYYHLLNDYYRIRHWE
jgi:aldehyde:ferredoxin oxidoreductase